MTREKKGIRRATTLRQYVYMYNAVVTYTFFWIFGQVLKPDGHWTNISINIMQYYISHIYICFLWNKSRTTVSHSGSSWWCLWNYINIDVVFLFALPLNCSQVIYFSTLADISFFWGLYALLLATFGLFHSWTEICVWLCCFSFTFFFIFWKIIFFFNVNWKVSCIYTCNCEWIQ